MAGLRERKRANTRAAIGRAALECFVARGYGAVTVADVAEAAGVAERTLFRHFADKEDLLFAEDEDFRAVLAATLAERPDGEPFVSVLLEGPSAILDALEPRRDELRERTTVIDAVASLQARERGKHAGLEAVLADGLITRGADAADARLLARVAIACYDEALRAWLADDAVGLARRYADNVAAVGRLLG